jgi:FemAB-related protein (PEP-CTERM system-associated)
VTALHAVVRAVDPPPASAPRLQVEAVDDSCAADWDAFVASEPGASVYHGYAWRRLVQSVFGHQTFYFAAREGAKIVGVLPLVRLKSRLFGDFLISVPYFNYGGVVAQSPQACDALLQHAAATAQSLGVSHIELRHRAAGQHTWPARTDKVAMLLELPATPEALQKTLPSKLRSQIKRPLREGVTCSFGGEELLDSFYAVFAENMRDLGTPVYPRRFFRAVLQTLGERARIALVRLREAPVAAALLVRHRDTTEIPWASSLRRVNGLGVNMYLYWSVLEFAVQQGSAVFDFGRSTLDSGTYRFKKQWGAEPLQLHWHYWLKGGGELPRLNPSNPKYRVAVAAWQKLPLPVANWLGPHLVKNLP